MQAGPTLLFCVGATKAGTSWLYSYLQGHPGCHLRSVKELHYFDAEEFGQHAGQIAQLQAQRDRLVMRGVNGAQIGDLDALIALHGGGGLEAYRDYVTEGAAGRLAADITPAYALVSEAQLRRMLSVLADVRVVYLMRDPVERLWSHVRMHARRVLREGEDFAAKAQRILRRILRKGAEAHITVRGDYIAALRKLRAVVPAARLHVQFFEDLVTAPGVDRLCAFLVLAPFAANVTQRVHAGLPAPLSEADRARAARLLAPQYAYVEQTYGPLPPRWQANMVRV